MQKGFPSESGSVLRPPKPIDVLWGILNMTRLLGVAFVGQENAQLFGLLATLKYSLLTPESCIIKEPSSLLQL